MALRHSDGRWTVSRTPEGDWHPEEVKAAVRIAGSTLDELSRRAGLPTFACRTAIRRAHFDGEMAVAEFLSLSPRQIWPSRWRADGSRIPAVRPKDNRPPADSGHRQNSEAA
ncbi:helix-turn-helix domain-containing protein [Segnochrobactrum spirostomi]|uniref:Transcriptional regulator n=1 Tax=Segnochrobactrum spirostomi TaxID=2608987 RepID=A0A6A7YAB5_9HYPH|nr:helix-turn-helix domain-containing protein [Segnochrobactrum spirostomi]MQT14419.1 transcriptional regulator [Segnochrobactrum spirostomi]